MTLSHSVCPGCGVALPTEIGPVHAYVPTSPECWRLFAETLTTVTERLFSDAYMVQHPSGDDPRQIQSVAVHLVTLNAVLKHGHELRTASKITAAAVDWGKNRGGYDQLDPPTTWEVTIADVADGMPPADYVRETFDVWATWAPERIEEWTGGVLNELYGHA